MKKMLRRLVSTLLVMGMLVTTVFAGTFPDVRAADSYAEAAEYLNRCGIMIGDQNGNFNPQKPVTRAEMATIIYRMLGASETVQLKSNQFSDVATGHWASETIAWAAQSGIVNGYQGKFSPSDSVTYEQAVTMIVRALGGEDEAQATGGYPNGYLEVAKRYGLLEQIKGSIGKALTRGDVALLVNNCLTHEEPTDNKNQLKTITEAQVLQKLQEAEKKWKNGSVYDDSVALCKQCYGFGRELFYYIYNRSLPTLWAVATARFVSQQHMENIKEVGHLGNGYSVAALEDLLLLAKPGDVLIATNGRTNHCVVIRSVKDDGSGIYVFDANWDHNNGIRTNALWSATGIKQSKPAAVTLYRYAQYSTDTKTYTVTFDANGGSVTPASRQVAEGTLLTDLPTPYRSGHEFLYWSTSTGSGMVVENKTLYITEDTTLYAHWKPICTGHIYDAERCTVCGYELPYSNGYDDSAAGVYQVIADKGYLRAGPYEIKESMETLKKGDTVQVRASVINSYGHVWLYTEEGYYIYSERVQPYIEEPKSYHVTLDDGYLCYYMTVTNGKPYGKLPVPEREGYIFDGWFTAKDGGKQITADTIVNLNGNQILYAHWTAKTQTWGPWSDWSTTKVTPSATRQVETREVLVSEGVTEYRYGRYVADGHDCWCGKYLESLSYVHSKATLQYSTWSATRYNANGKGWSCGYCDADHIGVDHSTSDGRDWWGEYVLPGGSFYWEESRTSDAVYETQYRYRDLIWE